MISILNDSSQNLLVQDLRIADNYFSRMRGLLFQSQLGQQQGLLIRPCKQVHTHFMSYPIRVIFLSRDMEVVQIIEELGPWKLSPWVKSSWQILELSTDNCQIIQVGDTLSIVHAE